MSNDEVDFTKFFMDNKVVILLAGPIVFLYFLTFLTATNKIRVLFDTSFLIMVLFIAALSLDLEVGSIGLPNFGKVGFIAIGAFISSIFYFFFANQTHYFNIGPFGPIFFSFGPYYFDNITAIVFGALLAVIIAGLFGMLIAFPTVKLRADYFAIMTIAGAEILRIIFTSESRYFQLPTDLPGVKTQVINNNVIKDLSQMTILGIKLEDKIELGNLGSLFYWQIALFLILSLIALVVYYFVEVIRNSPYGRSLRAIREDDITVTSVGKDVMKFRWQITTIAAVLCGLAGVLYAIIFTSFEADQFRPYITFDLFVFIIIGGLANSRGVFAGTSLIALFIRASQSSDVNQLFKISINKETDIIGPILDTFRMSLQIDPNNSRLVIVGIILIIFLLYKPSGLVPEPTSNNEKYLALLKADERLRSDQAVVRRQSVTEQERIVEQNDIEANKKESQDNHTEDNV